MYQCRQSNPPTQEIKRTIDVCMQIIRHHKQFTLQSSGKRQC
uniref:Uncharacterized protein n=1 Tax=Arundo donax TaxID=35708 RepID=A0A0A9HAF8_ARUDO